MQFLLLAITASTLILVSFKIFSRFDIDDFTAITINYIVGALFGFNFIHWNQTLPEISAAPWFPMAILTGVLLIAGFVLFAISTRKAGVAITAISSRMSVILPVMLGLLLLNDEAGIVKIAGIILALLALYLTLKKDNKEKFSIKLILVPLSVFLFMGLNDSAVKVTQHFFLKNSGDNGYVAYAATSFMIAFFIGVTISIFRIWNGAKVFKFQNLIAGVVLGLLNWFSIYYLLKGFEIMQVSVFIPILNISVVALSSVIGFTLFKEKLHTRNWAGILLAVIAIVLIAG